MIQTPLSAKQERALVALMGAKSLDQAAAQAGVGQRTLRRWLQQDAFQEAIQKLRRAAMSSATAHLQNVAWDAVEALRYVDVEAAEESDRIRWRAKTAGGDPVDIQLIAQDPEHTELRIRIGVFGNEARSRLVLEQIRRSLR